MATSSGCETPKSMERQGTFVPNVEEHMKPKIGMAFGSIEEAWTFYKKYGQAAGFDVRSSTAKTVNNVIVAKSFVCSKEGRPKSRGDGVRRTGSCRTMCKAMIRLKYKAPLGRYEVFSFKEAHNHDFTTPSNQVTF